MARVPFDPPYTVDDLPQLDELHDEVGLGAMWKGSEQRLIISNTPNKENQNGTE